MSDTPLPPSLCPTSPWNQPYVYCQCSLDTIASTICWLWGVPWYWLAITLAIWILAVFANFVVDLMIAILSIFIRRWGAEEWIVILKQNMLRSTTWLLRWGLFWAGTVTLNLPPNVNVVLKYLLSIPFFILLFPFANDVFNSIDLILQDYLQRSLRKAPSERKAKDKILSKLGETNHDESTNQSIGAETVPLTLDFDDDTEGKQRQFSKSISWYGQERGKYYFFALGEFLRVLKYITFFFIVILGLQYNDVPVIQLLQEASVVTISVVFAAQPWIRNLIGGLQNFFGDKFVVGDTIRVIGVEGKVNRLTLRSTTVERADKSLVYIPNSRLMQQPVFNLSRRKTRRLEVRFQLSRKTPSAKLRQLLIEVEQSLRALHPSLISHPDNPERLSNPDQFFVVLDSMYELLVWTATTGDECHSKPFQEIQGEVMLAVQEKLEELGVEQATEEETKRCMQAIPPRQSSPEERTADDLQVEDGRPFIYNALSRDDFHDDDEDLSMTTVATSL